MKMRILSEPCFLHGRAYRPQVLKTWWFLYWWSDLEVGAAPYEKIGEAMAAAEQYAKGTWVSDTATFR